MRKIVWLSLVLAVACTKHNPEACCSTADQCSGFGLSGITPCEGNQVCNTDGACVAPLCSTNADCTDPSMPTCENGFCVAMCGSDADCPTAMPFCESHVCVAGCGSDADCGGNTPYCAASGACVACVSDAMCKTESAPVCDGSANTCRGCVADSECASGICLESNGTCADASAAVFVTSSGSDSGTCTQASPCATLGYAAGQMSGAKNVLKILGNTYSVVATATLNVTGFVDGAPTVITGDGSDGIINMMFGNAVFSGLTLDGTNGYAADIRGGIATFYGDTIDGTIAANASGTLTLDHSAATNVYCGVALSGGAGGSPGALNIVESQVVLVNVEDCPTTIERSTIDNTSTPSNTGFFLDIAGSAASFQIENSVLISVNGNAFGPGLVGQPGDKFRFNTIVNLSGQDDMGEAINCEVGGPYDVSNNIIAWHTSLNFACPVTYTLVDSIEALPPGDGNVVGDAATFFANMAGKDFHLGSASPAIGAGSGEADVTTDYDGNPRPNPTGSRPDVGAFESPM